jgi:hypothetical protein
MNESLCATSDGSRIRGRHVTVDLSLLADLGKTTVAEIQAVVGNQFRVTREDLRSPQRDAHLAWARHVAMFVARSETRASLPAIGAAFGNRGHTTVLHGVRRVSARARDDSEARREVVDALTALWLGLVERRLHRATRSDTDSSWWTLQHDPRVPPAESSDAALQVTDLARTTIHERYSARESRPSFQKVAGASWATALTFWLVRLESSVSTATIASVFGSLDEANLIEAVRCVNSHASEDPRMRDELFALVEALRLRRDPSRDRLATGLVTTAPIISINYDAHLDGAFVCPLCVSKSDAQTVTAIVCRYFGASPTELRRDDDAEMRWARDLAIFLITAERRPRHLAAEQKQLDDIVRRVRDRVVHDEAAREQFLAILEALRADGRVSSPRTANSRAALLEAGAVVRPVGDADRTD